MARILLIETSTSVLSVALAVDGTVACERVCEEPRKQASLTAPLVKEVLDEAGLSARELDAVCVSSGPGSYTGLRVGVSTAKGVAFGAGIPLLSIGTLDILVSGVSGEGAPQFIVPMIDARRMEVYTAVYSSEGERLTPVEAKVIGPDAFREYLEQGEVLFVGDGALKCREVIQSPAARFQEAHPLARHMAAAAQKAFEEGNFVATVSKKNLW